MYKDKQEIVNGLLSIQWKLKSEEDKKTIEDAITVINIFNDRIKTAKDYVAYKREEVMTSKSYDTIDTVRLLDSVKSYLS